MFVFNFAGHDTTAHTFVFALFFLAAHPHIQDWLSQEIRHVFGQRAPAEWNYKTDFPRLRRCSAVLFETLRLYSPVAIAKWTDDHYSTLTVAAGDKTLVIPPRTMVVPSHTSVHTDPRYWGEDSLAWRPQRWIKDAPSMDEEELITPLRGTFIAWADGPRDCPGRKFSQVEFVATMAAVFGKYRVDPAVNKIKGETLESARERVLRFIEEDTGMMLLVQMLHPERCPLAWRKVPA